MNLIEAYSILDVKQSASFKEVKANYQWLVKTYHPDVPGTGDDVELRKIIEAFKVWKNEA
jgi:curved DNA-binding protein CbpA